MSLHLDSTYPFWLLLPIAVIAGWIMWFLYFRMQSGSPLPKGSRILLGINRFIVIVLTGLLFISPWIRTAVKKEVKPVFILARDNSSSMKGSKDSAILQDLRNDYLDRLAGILKKDYEVQEYLFGEKARPGRNWNYSDFFTRSDVLFDEVRLLSQTRDIGGMIVVTDGVVTRGKSFSEAARNFPIPVYFLATGDTSRLPDLSILEIATNEWVRRNSLFQARIYFKLEEWPDDPVRIRITGREGVLAEKDVEVGDQTELYADFEIQAPDHGTLELKAAILSGLPEKNVENNQRSFRVHVIGEDAQVMALYEAPHPDLAAIEKALGGLPQVVIEARQAGDFDTIPKSCNLLIFHGLPSVIHPVKQVLGMARLRKIPMMFIMTRSTEPGLSEELSMNLSVGSLRKEPEPVQGVLSQGFTLFTLPEDFTEHLKAWPPLYVPFESYAPASSVTNMVTQRIGSVELPDPLILFSRPEDSKLGIITAEGIWMWRMHDYLEFGDHRVFDEMVARIIQYLLQDEQKDHFSVTFPQDVNEYMNIRVTARLINESFESVNQPDVTLSIANSAGQVFEYLMGRSADYYELNLPGFPAGDYNYEAITQMGPEKYSDQGLLRIVSLYQEQKDPVAEHGDLKLVSYITGGGFYVESEVDGFLHDMGKIKPPEKLLRPEYKWYDLINLAWLFGLLVLFLALEWFFRRWYGTR